MTQDEVKRRIMQLRDEHHGTCDRASCGIRALWDEDCAEIAEVVRDSAPRVQEHLVRSTLNAVAYGVLDIDRAIKELRLIGLPIEEEER